METPLPGRWRTDVAFGLLIASLAGLLCYHAWLIRHGRAEAQRLAALQQRMTHPVAARDGNIFGRVGQRYVLLAGSRRVPACFVDASILADEDFPRASIQLGSILNVSPLEIQDTLLQRRTARYVPLKWPVAIEAPAQRPGPEAVDVSDESMDLTHRPAASGTPPARMIHRMERGLTDDQAMQVRQLGLRAVGVEYHWRRVYPNGPLAADVLGYRRADGRPGAGIELTMDEHLTGSEGTHVALADARRRPVRPLVDQCVTARDGSDVFLSIDLVIQRYCQEAVAEAVESFGGKWGVGIVIEPSTGRVLAMCSAPGFDPNHFSHASAADRTNRSVSMPYEPGSVLKPLLAAAAVQEGILSYTNEIYCEQGRYRAPRGGTITDHGKSYEWLTLREIVEKSSNIGMAKVGEVMGNQRLYDWLARFGLGTRTGVELPGESPGIVRPLNKWDGYSLRRVPFGQEVSTTALQLAMAFGAVANGGVLMKPQLVDRVRDAEGTIVYQGRPQAVRRVLSADVAGQTLAAMGGVVEQGTGKACAMTDWTSFGKTGTAQISGPGGYVDGAYTGSFVGGAPVKHPRVLCLISVYWPDRSKGYYGGTVAAPYVRRVLEQSMAYLRVPPDKTPQATWALR